jgi:hypothetical protein
MRCSESVQESKWDARPENISMFNDLWSVLDAGVGTITTAQLLWLMESSEHAQGSLLRSPTFAEYAAQQCRMPQCSLCQSPLSPAVRTWRATAQTSALAWIGMTEVIPIHLLGWLTKFWRPFGSKIMPAHEVVVKCGSGGHDQVHAAEAAPDGALPDMETGLSDLETAFSHQQMGVRHWVCCMWPPCSPPSTCLAAFLSVQIQCFFSSCARVMGQYRLEYLATSTYGARYLPYVAAAEHWAEQMQHLGIIVWEKGAKEYLDYGISTDGMITWHLQILTVLVFLHSILNESLGMSSRCPVFKVVWICLGLVTMAPANSECGCADWGPTYAS